MNLKLALHYLIWLLMAISLAATFLELAVAQGPSGGRPPFRHGDDGLPSLAEPPEFRPPSSPNPPSLLPDSFPGSPDENKIWKCSKCNAVLGRSPVEPKIERCPYCGATLTSWFNYYIVGGVGGAVLAGLVILNLVVQALRRRK